MILRILGFLIGATILLFIAYWVYSGGFSNSLKLVHGLDNPFTLLSSTSTGGALHLPGQPDSLVDTINTTEGDTGSVDGGDSSLSAQDQLSALQNQYDQLSAEAKDPKNFGNPSPYRNQVTFGDQDAQAGTPDSEYLTLQAGYANTAPISLAGWSLQSAVTGARIVLPQAAPEFVSGVLNNVASVSLSAGSMAYIVSGPSPVGVSFRENICTGYLAELQKFTPELNLACPLASDELSLNAQNIANFGDTCIDYAKSLSQCHFPGLDTRPDVTDVCENFLLTRLSYNGCMYAHRNDSNFYSSVWRLYLASGVPLWRDTHDVIRLLDAQGRTVDVLTY
jgi:hypothetical protein